MAFVEPITLIDRNLRLEPLSLAHEAGLRTAAADGELWNIRVTSVPEPDQTRKYIEDALQMRGDLWYEDRPGGGAAFVFELPAARFEISDSVG